MSANSVALAELLSMSCPTCCPPPIVIHRPIPILFSYLFHGTVWAPDACISAPRMPANGIHLPADRKMCVCVPQHVEIILNQRSERSISHFTRLVARDAPDTCSCQHWRRRATHTLTHRL